MNKIKTKVKVEYKKLLDITVWDKKFSGIKNNFEKNFKHVSAAKLKEFDDPEGNIKLISTGNFTGYAKREKVKEYINKGEILTIPTGGSANIKYFSGEFVDSGNLIATSIDDEKYNLKYIYYNLLEKNELIETFFRGPSVKHPDMPNILKIKIPIPPIEVQNDIVKILDTFTELKAKLTAELEMRKKQYEFYRDELLINEHTAVLKPLGDICTLVRGPFGGSLKKECFVSDGYAVYEQQHAIYDDFSNFRYFIEDTKYAELKRFSVNPGDMIMSCSGTMGKIAIVPDDAPKGVINQALLKITVGSEVDRKYLKYCFENTISKQMNDNARGGAIKNVASVAELKRTMIAVPPIETQKRLVKVLDNFDAICSDLNIGLPAEIEMREKQYKYYRNKLLSFK